MVIVELLFWLWLASDISDLRLRTPVKGQISDGSVNAYRVDLSVGQFAQLALDQGEADLILEAYSPTGEKIGTRDARDRGVETFSLICEKPGSYRFEVRPAGKSSQLQPYRLELRTLRSRQPDDAPRITAEQISTEGKQLIGLWTAESMRRGIEKERTALKLWRELRDQAFEVSTLVSIGEAYHALSDFSAAQQSFREALPISRALRDERSEGAILNNLGMGCWQLGEIVEAADYMSKAVTVWRSMKFRYGEAATLSNLGILSWESGDWQEALTYYLEALTLIRSLKDTRGEAYVLNNIGMAYNSLDENRKALDYLGMALERFRSTGDQAAEGRALLRIGQIYAVIGNSRQAKIAVEQALPLIVRVGDRLSEGDALNQLGQIEDEQGDNSDALEHYDRAMKLFQAAGSRRGQSAALHNAGVAFLSAGRVEQAREVLTQALAIRGETGIRDGAAQTSYELAVLERSQDNLAEARKHVESAIDIAETLRTRVAGQQLRASYFSSKQRYYKTYIDILMQMDALYPKQEWAARAFETAERARARSLLDQLGEDRMEIRRGVDPGLIERERAIQRRLNFYAQLHLKLLNQLDRDGRARVAERELERALTEYAEIESVISAANPAFAEMTRGQPLSLAEIQTEILDQDTVLLQYSLGIEHSYVWTVTDNSIRTFVLPGQVEVDAAAARLYEFLSSSKSALTAADLAQVSQAEAVLGKMILPPKSALDRKRVVLVAEGSLLRTAFGALPDPASGRPLMSEYEIVNLPSASTVAMVRRGGSNRAPPPNMVAVMADPVFDNEDARVKNRGNGRGQQNVTRSGRPAEAPAREWADGAEISRLPFSRREAQNILNLAPANKSRLFLDFAANRRTVIEGRLGQYRIVHFATHGLLNDAHPELSGVILSLVDVKGMPQDGFLRLHDIYNLELPVDLVVLSACQTGLGKEIKGEGVIGLTRGFMYAGASRVVVSLWKVDDEASAEMMRLFYGYMLGSDKLRPPAALRAAQDAIRKQGRWRHPYYWAGFIIQGEWQ